jgi:protein prenyltransferase alpha subunit repeat containing protein 1
MESIDWNFEISLCERCSEKTTSNYHSWCHRQWVLRQAHHLIKFELIKTEKFIRKHIYDYSCYHHRQHVLTKLYEIGYYEPDETVYRHLKDFVSTITGIEKVETTKELLRTFLPNTNDNLDDVKVKILLYSLNNAACDIKFCEELKFMYNNCQAFEYHRRATVKFMVDLCRAAIGISKNVSNKCTNGSVNEASRQPQSKILKIDVTDDGLFLQSLKSYEGMRGNDHRKWCKIFLGFEFSD